MARQGATSSLRRRSTPIGGLFIACLVLAAPAPAATPTPDPPPFAVAPEPPQREPKPEPKAAPVRQAPVVSTRPPVVTRSVVRPVIVTREAPAKPKPTAKVTRKPKPAVVARTLPPHDRTLLPLPAAADVAAAVERFDRGLLALAGAGLAFVALGGAVVLAAARRQLGELA